LGFGGGEFLFGGRNVGFHSAHVGLHPSHFPADRADLLLLFLRQTFFGRALGRLQLRSARRQFFLCDADLLAECLRLGFGRLHALGGVGYLWLGRSLILRQLGETSALVDQQVQRGCHVDRRQQKQKPLAGVAAATVVYNRNLLVLLVLLGHRFPPLSWKGILLLLSRTPMLSIASLGAIKHCLYK